MLPDLDSVPPAAAPGAPPVETPDARREGARAGRLRWLVLAVPALGVAELVGHLYFANRAPRGDDWAAIQPIVEKLRRPDDVVVVAPYWAEPMARWKLGDALMPLRDVARPDATRYPRAIELSAVGETSPELAGWPVEAAQRAGKIVVRTRRNPSPPHVTFDFVDHLRPGAAEVELASPDGAPAPCGWTETAGVDTGGLFGAPTFPSSRYRCAVPNPFIFVGTTIIDDEREHPRRCIWSHPPGGATELVTRFRAVPLGSVIRGHMGMGWMIERDRPGPPITLKIRVNGEPVGEAVHVDGQGWAPFEVPLGAHAGATADVEFRASAANDRFRHLCFEADSR